MISDLGSCRICKTVNGSDIEILFDIIRFVYSVLSVILVNRINDLLYLRTLDFLFSLGQSRCVLSAPIQVVAVLKLVGQHELIKCLIESVLLLPL